MTRDDKKRGQRFAKLERTTTRVAVGLVIAGPVLGMAAGVLGALEVYPYEHTMTVALTSMLVPIGLALLVGAVVGLYVLGGAKLAPFGAVFVAGFAALVYGIVAGATTWFDVGVGLLTICGGVFYLAGVVSGRAPAAAHNTSGLGVAVVGGPVVAVAGQLLGQWGLLLFGAMAFGCGVGGVLGHWWVVRRRPE
ncbi:hypothetical protein ACFS2C_04070 [Prauserella oleivorans]|uniref:DUF1097 domain-containing protein n=1 Tax=Prauserella oleivorans TaxID=1478153 RepID=A0ABW5W3Q0_9PSEU